MWPVTYSLSYHMVSEGRPVFPLAEMSSAGCSQNHGLDPSRIIHWKIVCLSQSLDISRRWPRIGFNEHRKWLRNEERGGGKDTTQHGQGLQLLGDAAGQPKPTCYPEGISSSKQADDRRRIHFGHRIDCQSILAAVSTWWCGCIQIVRKISFATSFICKEPPWRTNSNIKCPLNTKNQMSFGRTWWG